MADRRKTEASADAKTGAKKTKVKGEKTVGKSAESSKKPDKAANSDKKSPKAKATTAKTDKADVKRNKADSEEMSSHNEVKGRGEEKAVKAADKAQTKKKPQKRADSALKDTTPVEETSEERSARQIVDVLKVLGVYSPAFDTLIESCAHLRDMRDRVYNEVRSCEAMVVEISREGAERKRANPAYALYIEINKELRAVLESLTMTVKSSSLASSDELDKLNAKLAAIMGGYNDRS